MVEKLVADFVNANSIMICFSQHKDEAYKPTAHVQTCVDGAGIKIIIKELHTVVLVKGENINLHTHAHSSLKFYAGKAAKMANDLLARSCAWI